MILARSEEQGHLNRLLADACAGKSGALVIRGEPGIGKSALLRFAVARAEGMTVLAATGIESESELAFAGLSELLSPILALRHQIPEPQAAGLAGALALGPPTAIDRLTISAATLSLLALAAEQQPVLAVVDDAHWLDVPSRDAILFAARRLQADRIAILLTARTGESIAFDAPGITELILKGIDGESCRALLASNAGAPIAELVVQQITLATAGNPLAIIEVVHELSAEQLAGREAIDEPLPTGPRIQRSFERRAAGLPAAAQLPLLIAAACQTNSASEVRRACQSVGADFDALQAAEQAGLISIDGRRVQFGHPLMRAAVYNRATAPERRVAHRALADAIPGEAGLIQRAWHVAAATVGENEEVAATLEQAGLDARRRSAHAAAVTAFERAARLTPDPETRARRFLEAGSDAHVAGQSSRAMALLDEAGGLARQRGLRAEILHMRGRVEMWTRSPGAARKFLLDAAAVIEDEDPEKTALILVDAATTCHQEGDPVEGVLRPALRLSSRALDLAKGVGGVAAAAAAGLRGKTLIVLGRAAEGYPLLLQGQAAFEESESLWVSVQLAQCAVVFLWLEEFDRARTSLERLIAKARAVSAPGALPYPLAHLSEVDYRTGRWAAAEAGAAEAVQLAEELGQSSALIYGLACLAWVEAARGQEQGCRAHLDRALKLYGPIGVTIGAYAVAILGLLELGLGRNNQAIAQLEILAKVYAAEGVGEPSLFQSTPNLIEAYVHAGRRADAGSTLALFDIEARNTQRTWALACSARCHGLLDQHDFDQRFQEALAWHARTPTPFERARTELCFGERLRRARRRGEARNNLHAALETFEQLGAQTWADRARAELRATGESVQGRPVAESLTLQELQVALKVAQGATNREVASDLFISPKTVEVHLSRVYSKLGFRSRTELASRFARGGAPGK
jgi:DNA-binding CsgD family transcriptional regulator